MKRISPTIFGLALICFLLPWINVSCQGQKIVSFTGVNLVSGTTIKEPQMFGQARARRVGGEKLAVVTLLVVIVGGILSFSKGKLGNTGPAAAGAAGVISLFMLKSKLESDALAQGQGLLQVNYEMGFYLIFILFVSAIAINVFAMSQRNALIPERSPGVQTESGFCSSCGEAVISGVKYCANCGSKFGEG